MMDLHGLSIGSILRIPPSTIFTKAFVAAGLVLLYVLHTRYATPLRKIPGPFLASISKLWLVQKTRGLQRQKVDLWLRKKYGSIVRIAPNEVLVSDLNALKTIYGISQFLIESSLLLYMLRSKMRNNVRRILADKHQERQTITAREHGIVG
jgi:hypothetical protein